MSLENNSIPEFKSYIRKDPFIKPSYDTEVKNLNYGTFIQRQKFGEENKKSFEENHYEHFMSSNIKNIEGFKQLNSKSQVSFYSQNFNDEI